MLKKYPWLVERGQKCVISPDADGILCGLFMSQYLDWEVVGNLKSVKTSQGCQKTKLLIELKY